MAAGVCEVKESEYFKLPDLPGLEFQPQECFSTAKPSKKRRYGIMKTR